MNLFRTPLLSEPSAPNNLGYQVSMFLTPGPLTFSSSPICALEIFCPWLAVLKGLQLIPNLWRFAFLRPLVFFYSHFTGPFACPRPFLVIILCTSTPRKHPLPSLGLSVLSEGFFSLSCPPTCNQFRMILFIAVADLPFLAFPVAFRRCITAGNP